MENYTLREVLPQDSKELLEIFNSAYQNKDVPSAEYSCFEEELASRGDDSQIYQIKFFCIEHNNTIVSFAGIANSLYYDGSWELRWGTTRPEYQSKGLMTLLTKKRIDYAKENTLDMPGIIHISSRQPTLYKKLGFSTQFIRGPKNRSEYMTLLFNQHLSSHF